MIYDIQHEYALPSKHPMRYVKAWGLAVIANSRGLKVVRNGPYVMRSASSRSTAAGGERPGSRASAQATMAIRGASNVNRKLSCLQAPSHAAGVRAGREGLWGGRPPPATHGVWGIPVQPCRGATVAGHTEASQRGDRIPSTRAVLRRGRKKPVPAHAMQPRRKEAEKNGHILVETGRLRGKTKLLVARPPKRSKNFGFWLSFPISNLQSGGP